MVATVESSAPSLCVSTLPLTATTSKRDGAALILRRFICLQCNQAFESTCRNPKYCSDNCGKSHRKLLFKNGRRGHLSKCLHCSKEIRHLEKEKKYCSFECSHKHRKKRATICKECGGPVTGRTVVGYCSRKCAQVSLIKRGHKPPIQFKKGCVPWNKGTAKGKSLEAISNALIMGDYKRCTTHDRKSDEDHHWLKHPVAIRRGWVLNMTRKMSTNLEFKMLCRMRSRVRCALKKNLRRAIKSQRTMSLVGCSPAFLIQWLEQRFTNGMSWGNYGLWHIDHALPCASFDLSKLREQRKCFHYTNLQPLWATHNISKGDKVMTQQQLWAA